MARIRYLKPGFFTNDELGALNPLCRILFQGLWCYADRRGRLEDRPGRIKVVILPYDDVDVDSMLDTLQSAGFIVRYVANGKRYIQIITFELHQSPNVKEPESIIPAPCQHDTSISLTGTEQNRTGTEQEGEQSARADRVPHSSSASPLSPLPDLATITRWAQMEGREEEAEPFFLKMTERGWLTFGANPVPIRGPDAAHAALKRWIASANKFLAEQPIKTAGTSTNGHHANSRISNSDIAAAEVQREIDEKARSQ